jgi:hypothetical protein
MRLRVNLSIFHIPTSTPISTTTLPFPRRARYSASATCRSFRLVPVPPGFSRRALDGAFGPLDGCSIAARLPRRARFRPAFFSFCVETLAAPTRCSPPSALFCLEKLAAYTLLAPFGTSPAAP